MSAPDIFLLLDRRDREAVLRTLHHVLAGWSVQEHDGEVHFANDEYYLWFSDFNLIDFVLFSSECREFAAICGHLRRFETPHVCVLTTRSLAAVNAVAHALYRDFDMTMDNDHGLLIDKQTFLQLYAEGRDWLRLAPDDAADVSRGTPTGRCGKGG